ncbi:MAG: 4-hydroxy-tetrahydrodipicolinate reductase [Alphaproteobacteria bacterium MarineAlpha8_Bin1]|nr:MAG: 4-hydroxy-tetrahydrodipicolinate reductase [Alphaproteobacteria bacterium MarineAlpha8_Bin1]|tara:strand:+ start:938 stop:1711 length:774 start_codon:yes stop_codon:yes gene_type:complete
MKKINVGIFGPEGRMGKDIISRIKDYKNLKISALCERKNHPSIGRKVNDCIITDDVKKLVECSDVIIDFSIPEATLKLLQALQNKKVCLITGTTGYSKRDERSFLELSKKTTILRSFNMSIGINLLKSILKSCSKKIGKNSDIEIVEIHHNKKKDLPSGTALSLADSINEGLEQKAKLYYREKSPDRKRKKNEIGFSSIRGGEIIGTHTIFFFMDGEKIEFTHTALDRKIFSCGALDSIEWILSKKPGLYSLVDMLS